MLSNLEKNALPKTYLYDSQLASRSIRRNKPVVIWNCDTSMVVLTNAL